VATRATWCTLGARDTFCSTDGDRYWNWELDWPDVTKSPIWDAEHGFGSDGKPGSSEPILKGYCVENGPFAHLEIPYLDEKGRSHCLSRGFLSDDNLTKEMEALEPNEMKRLLALKDYDSFNLGLEDGPHLAIPHTIQGDFLLLTAPSGKIFWLHVAFALTVSFPDPVFFLHHGQLDRLWWRWQGQAADRLSQYGGLKEHGSNETASKHDKLRMGGLAPDMPVADILNVGSKPWCYGY
jgi:tyrosinase